MTRLALPFATSAIALAIAFGVTVGRAAANDQETASFAGKTFKNQTISAVIGDKAGGGTDVFGRIIDGYFSKYLPGHPQIVAYDVPGAGGVTAMNRVVHQAKPDGLTLVIGSTSQVDPKRYRDANAKYDPTTFDYIGGIVRGGYALIIRTSDEKRLHDKSMKPVAMGSIGGIPRNSFQQAMWGMEYLGWNAKWVAGYPGTPDLMIALDRGEVDMTGTGSMAELSPRLKSGKFKLVSQTGNTSVDPFQPRPDFGATPIFADLMKGKIADPVAKQAFQYWLALNGVDKFVALAPGTPADIVAEYRAAFAKIVRDPEFLEKGKSSGDEFVPVPAEAVANRVEMLANIQPSAVDYITGLLRKQGLNFQ
jgi:tripartite-type tricarboxylate transporter receptor subunit TctC